MQTGEIKRYLAAHGLKPKHYLGQNFLIDESVLDEIMGAAEIKKTDTVIEVGPGLGVLTARLANAAGKVIAVEKDRMLLNVLKANLAGAENVEIIIEDILRFDVSKHVPGPYKVVANIPYYLTSHLFGYFLNQNNKPKAMVLMVQKEVGERVVAKPGDLSVLGISVQIMAKASVAAMVPRAAFWPVPKVDSLILKIVPNDLPKDIEDDKLFFRMVKIAFSGKRKQVHNTLAAGFKLSKEEVVQVLAKAKISPSARPQELSLEDWKQLYRVIHRILAENRKV